MLTDGVGVPLAVTIDGANRHDMKLVARTLNSLAIERPQPTNQQPQHLCMDKGYDYPDVRDLIDKWGYTAHIVPRGVEKSACEKIPGYRARRWVVERTHSWLNRFRRLLIRWEKKVKNHTALMHLAFAYITLRQTGVVG